MQNSLSYKHLVVRLFAVLVAVIAPAVAVALLFNVDQTALEGSSATRLQLANRLPALESGAQSSEAEIDFEEQKEESSCQSIPLPIVSAPPNVESVVPRAKRTKRNRSQAIGRAPVQGYTITSRYGMRVHPVTGRHAFHNGVDYSAKLNQRVFSVADGVVTRCGPRGALGIAVEIYHPSRRASSIYGHLNEELVYRGQPVRSGQTIGLAGTTGRSTGVHVHFTVKRDCRYVEPMQFLASLPERMDLLAPEQTLSTLREIAAAKSPSSDVRSLARVPMAAARTFKNSRTRGESASVYSQTARSVIARAGRRGGVVALTRARKQGVAPLVALKPSAIQPENAKSVSQGTLSSKSLLLNEHSRRADGPRLAVEITAQLAKTKAALKQAQHNADIALALYNEGAISRRAAEDSKARTEELQQKLNDLEHNSVTN